MSFVTIVPCAYVVGASKQRSFICDRCPMTRAQGTMATNQRAELALSIPIARNMFKSSMMCRRSSARPSTIAPTSVRKHRNTSEYRPVAPARSGKFEKIGVGMVITDLCRDLSAMTARLMPSSRSEGGRYPAYHNGPKIVVPHAALRRRRFKAPAQPKC